MVFSPFIQKWDAGRVILLLPISGEDRETCYDFAAYPDGEALHLIVLACFGSSLRSGGLQVQALKFRSVMANFSPYPGAYPGRRNPASKAPQGWSAALQTRKYEEEALTPVQVKREAVADRASPEGGGGGGGGGGANLPFMIQNLYLAPCKTATSTAYTMTRLQPKDVEKPSWAH